MRGSRTVSVIDDGHAALSVASPAPSVVATPPGAGHVPWLPRSVSGFVCGCVVAIGPGWSVEAR